MGNTFTGTAVTATTTPSIVVDYATLRYHLGLYLRWDRDAANWTNDQTNDANRVINKALRGFYNPPSNLQHKPSSHQWSFLRIKHLLKTQDGRKTYQLPDHFGGIVGDLTFNDEDDSWHSVQRVGEGKIFALRQRDIDSTSVTGRPIYYAVIAREHTGDAPQLQDLHIYPTANGVYTLNFTMRVEPLELSTTHPYPWGGQRFGEVILEAVLAEAEQTLNDEIGLHSQKYMSLLAAAISTDSQMYQADFFGYNDDRSDGVLHDRRYKTPVTYNGVSYGS